MQFNYEVLGKCKGVELVPMASNDPHICIQILTEDDENWLNNGLPFSSFWIDDQIEMLQAANAYMEANCVKDKWGYYFKKNNL